MRKILRRIFLGILVAVLLTGMGFFAFWHYREAKIRGELATIEARWQAAGWPLTAAELLGPPPPDELNAALVWAEIAELLRAWKTMARAGGQFPPKEPPLHWNLEDITQAAPNPVRRGELLAEMEKITPLREVDELLEKLADLPFCHWPRAVNSLTEFDMQDEAELLFLGQVLAARAVLQGWDGRWEESTRHLARLRRLSTDLQRDPFLISWLVGVSVDLMSEEAWRALLEAGGGPETLLAGEVPGAEPDFAPGGASREKLARALDGERIFFGQEVFRILRENESSVPGLWRQMTGQPADEPMPWDSDALLLTVGGWIYQWPARYLLDRDQLTYLNFQEKFREQLQQAEMTDLLADAAEDQMFSDIPATAILTRLAVPAYSGVLRRLGVVETQRQISRLGQQVLLHRQHHGAWPANLEEVADGSPVVDAFSGDPLVYLPQEDGFVLYSRGINRQDDGGTDSRQDLVWRFGDLSASP